MASVNIAYHTIGMVNTITFAYINPALWTYVTQFVKTGHNSAFTEIHFIAPSRFGH